MYSSDGGRMSFLEFSGGQRCQMIQGLDYEAVSISVR